MKYTKKNYRTDTGLSMCLYALWYVPMSNWVVCMCLCVWSVTKECLRNFKSNYIRRVVSLYLKWRHNHLNAPPKKLMKVLDLTDYYLLFIICNKIKLLTYHWIFFCISILLVFAIAFQRQFDNKFLFARCARLHEHILTFLYLFMGIFYHRIWLKQHTTFRYDRKVWKQFFFLFGFNRKRARERGAD